MIRILTIINVKMRRNQKENVDNEADAARRTPGVLAQRGDGGPEKADAVDASASTSEVKRISRAWRLNALIRRLNLIAAGQNN